MAVTEENVFLAVGSNIDPLTNVPRAFERLLAEERLIVCETSTFYRTAPVARPGQSPFANGVWRIATGLSPLALKTELLRPLEAELGRVRTSDRHAPRPIDLDVILYGNVMLNSPECILPDPDITTRAFVAGPLAELSPTLSLPGSDEPMELIAERLGADTMEPWIELTERIRRLLHP